MKKNGNNIQCSEEEIPGLARSATRSAYRKVLKSGNTVLVSRNGEINEVFPDGSSRFVKKARPTVKIQKGTIIRIK